MSLDEFVVFTDDLVVITTIKERVLCIMNTLNISRIRFVILFIAMLGTTASAVGATYYNENTGSPSATGSWTLNSNGTNGTAPSNFTTSGDIFIIRAGTTATLTATWTFGNSNNVTLQIQSGATLALGTNALTISGNLENNGSITGSGSITISGTYASQAISNATTTGSMFFSKTSGTTTFTGASSAASFTINGTTGTSTITVDGTLTLSGNINYSSSTSASITRNFTGTGTIQCVDLNIGSAITVANAGTITTVLNSSVAQLNVTDDVLMISNNNNSNRYNNAQFLVTGGIIEFDAFGVTNDVAANTTLLQVANATLKAGNATPFPTPTGTFTRDFTGTNATVNYDGTAQTVFATTYNNLVLSGNGGKTFPTGTTTVNGTLSIENGTNANTFTGTLAYGAAGILQYNTSSNRNVGSEWPATIDASTGPRGGVIIANTGIITLNAGKTLGASTNVPLTINSGATLATNNTALTFHGDFINNGTLTAGSSTITITGTIANQNIGTFTTTGAVTLSKSSGTATFTGNINGAALTINGTGTGTLNLGAGLTHTFTGQLSGSGGVLNGGSSTLKLSASPTPVGTAAFTFTPSTGTIDYSGTGQTIVATTYYNLACTNSGTKTAGGNITVNNELNIASGVTFDLSTNQLSGASLTTTGTGILKTSNTGNTPIPSGKTWTMDVQFVASSNQNIPAGTYSKTVSIQGSNTAKLITGNITANTLDLTSGSIVLNDINGTPYTLTITSQIIRAVSGGTIDGVNDGVLEFANSNALLDIPQGTFGVGGINNMKISGGKTVRLASDYNGNLSLETLTTTGTGSYFDMNGYTLTITNSVTMSNGNGITGSLKGGSAPITGSSLIIGGVANQANIGTLYFDQTTPDVTNSLYNLTIGTTGGGSVTLGNKMNIRNTLQPPTSGTFTFNADSNLVIASRSTYTGRIAQINSGFSFGGKVIVERYVKNKTARRYIFLASPVDGISIRKGWQDDIFITSPASGGTACAIDSTNGLPNKFNDSGYDATTRKLVTIFTYNQADKKWDSVIRKSDSTYLQKGVGYRVYYRGSRGLNDANCSTMLESNSPTAPDSTIMDVDGTPTTGNVTVGVYGKGSNATYGYTLVGNPYPSELNFEVFQSDPTNSSIVSPTYWTHDPQSSSTTGYLSYNNNSIAGGVSKTSGVITGANGKYIASGQAFFVQSALSGNANAGSITFKETHKSSSQQLGVFRGTSNTLTWESRIRIGFLEMDSTAVDDVLVRFSDEASVTKAPSDFWDAPTLNATKYLGTIKSNRTFAIQTRPKNFINDTVMIRIVSNTTGNHILSFSEFDDFTEAAQIILIDQFTGIKTDVKANRYYTFTITSSAASQGGRFLLVFRSKESVMPVSFMNIAATQKQEGVEVAWKVAYEQNVQDYSVERSDNGRDFKVIATVLSKGNSNAPVAYTYMDLQPVNGKVYYRVKSNEKSGDAKYTSVVMLNSSKETLISVYPNPAKDNLQIQVSNPEMYKRVTILIRNAQGKTVIQQTAASANGKIIVNVYSLATGMYVISVINDKGESLMDKFVKQ